MRKPRKNYTQTELDNINRIIDLEEEIGKLKDVLVDNHGKYSIFQKIWKMRLERDGLVR
jgi:hypothetical protein